MTRLPHSFQVSATLRLERARTLLAEASGLMRACARETGSFVQPPDQWEPVQQALEIEEAESQLALIMTQIRKAPVGDEVR